MPAISLLSSGLDALIKLDHIYTTKVYVKNGVWISLKCLIEFASTMLCSSFLALLGGDGCGLPLIQMQSFTWAKPNV